MVMCNQSTTHTSAAESSRASPTLSTASQHVPRHYGSQGNAQPIYLAPDGQYDQVASTGAQSVIVATISGDVIAADSVTGQSPSFGQQAREEQDGQAMGHLPQQVPKAEPTGLPLTYPGTAGGTMAPTDFSSQGGESHFMSGPSVVQQDDPSSVPPPAPSAYHAHPFLSKDVGYSEIAQSTAGTHYHEKDGAHPSILPPVSQGYAAWPPVGMVYPGTTSSYPAQESGSLAPLPFPTQLQAGGSHQQTSQENQELESSGGTLHILTIDCLLFFLL